MNAIDDPAPGAQRKERLGWRGTIAGFVLGTMSVGIVVNLLSDDHGLRALATVTGIGAVFTVADWLRRFPGSKLQRAASILLWMLSAACILLAASVFSWAWSLGLTLAAAALLAVTVLLATTLHTAATLLGGAAAVGFGGTLAGLAGAWLPAGDVGTAVYAGTAVGLGVGTAVLGVVWLRNGAVPIGVLFAWTTALLATLGLANLAGMEPTMIGATAVGLGVALAGLGPPEPQGGAMLFGVATVGLGVAVALLGVRLGDVLFSAPIAGLGVAVAVLGLAWLQGRVALFGAAMIGAGVALALFAIPWMLGAAELFGVAMIGAGVAAAMAGMAMLKNAGIMPRLGRWWARITADQRRARPVADPRRPGDPTDTISGRRGGLPGLGRHR
ncbi:hypothetical protein ACIA5D_36360 [Actinoplanes sp. NPDC051513]|uniref:hypothetical protein n=1 Tax=Actinoplanes sp. NPDC051513 TaxID=3363908 RepID=UPI0037ABB7BC